MTKKLLKQLVIYSYANNELQQERILEVADRLEKKELKQYLKALQHAEKSKTVLIEAPFKQTEAIVKEFQELYPQKKVIMQVNPSLLSGVRITENDDIIEINLKHSLDAIVDYVNEAE